VATYSALGAKSDVYDCLFESDLSVLKDIDVHVEVDL